eukprot:10317811-Prorocentrum_lima.AAC.1
MALLGTIPLLQGQWSACTARVGATPAPGRGQHYMGARCAHSGTQGQNPYGPSTSYCHEGQGVEH